MIRTSFRVALLALPLLAACSKKAPTIDTFTASPDTITTGGTTTLSWTVSNADTVQIDNGVGTVTGGSVQVQPSSSLVYTLTATGAGGTAQKTTLVTVNAPGNTGARIGSFTATPSQAAPGDAVTLKWSVVNAAEISLSPAPPVALKNTDTQVVVNPQQTTTYVLAVKAANDPTAVTATTLVRIAAKATISNFATASGSTSVPRGTAVKLTWQSDGTRFTLKDSVTNTVVDLGPATREQTGFSTLVRPGADTTTYTLTAYGLSGASVPATLTLTLSGAQGQTLTYSAATVGSEAIRVERDAASTGQVVILNLVANTALTASQLALSLPLDAATPGSRDGMTRVALDTSTTAPPSGWVTVSPGFDVNAAVLDPGTNPPAAGAVLPTQGRLAGILTLGVARKPQAQCSNSGATCAGASGETTIAKDAVVARVRLKLLPAGGTGAVFTGTTGSGYRAVVRNEAAAQGTAGAFTSTSFAVGTLAVQ